ncbi:DNA damage-binding protein 2-like [Monodelphis domestica]|uniref:DNA damage-binding protein 2-like n=1 Tax=Monodelphis domestica TaxID=13616 RepID=UPI0000F2E972|nr:DNA damage-binding protein 2-like [Monodelphis domestica]
MAPKRQAGRGKRSFPPPDKSRCVQVPGRGGGPQAPGRGGGGGPQAPSSDRRDDASGGGLSGPREYPQSIIWALCQHKQGRAPQASFQQCLQQTFLHSLGSYRLFRTASPFDRRTTCLEWHPTHPSTLAVGSKGGDVILWDYEVLDKICFIKGIGAGGCITGMKFNPLNTNQLFFSSVEGSTILKDFVGNTIRVFARTNTWDNWYTSVDVSATNRVVVTGDSVGNVILLNMDGKEVWNLRLHKKKVSHVALNPHCDWLLATASVDQTVKIWDLRQVRGKSCFLHWMPHEHAVNAACFSPDGARLLTTDQHSEIRVYSASHWASPQLLIPHPHRHFQHLTPIKATWHPRFDLITVGRYPDPNFPGFTPYEPRTVDLFDGTSGKMVCQLHDPDCSGIISLNKFNPMGDTLASTMGYNILIWNPEEAVRRKQEGLIKAMSEHGIGRDCAAHRNSRRRRSRRGPTSSREQPKCPRLQGDARSKGKGKDPRP